VCKTLADAGIKIPFSKKTVACTLAKCTEPLCFQGVKVPSSSAYGEAMPLLVQNSSDG
jgi:hypothetical protein